MNNESESLVARAIEHARQVGWSAQFLDWANAWLDGTDRTAESALVALHRVEKGYLAPTWERQCLMDALTAAIQLGLGKAADATRWAERAASAGPDPRPQDTLIIDGEECLDPPRRPGNTNRRNYGRPYRRHRGTPWF